MSAPVDAMIAALTLAIPHPNPAPPPDQLPGTASPGDQVPIPAMIESLRKADTNATAANGRSASALAAATQAAAAYAASHAGWVAGQPTAFAAWDRAVRALETLLTGSAGPPLDSGDLAAAKARTNAAITLAKSRNPPPTEAIRALQADERLYFESLRNEPKPDARATRNAQSAADEASRASTALDAEMSRAGSYLAFLSIP